MAKNKSVGVPETAKPQGWGFSTFGGGIRVVLAKARRAGRRKPKRHMAKRRTKG